LLRTASVALAATFAAALFLTTSRAGAVSCQGFALNGAGPSYWTVSADEGDFEDAALFDQGLGAYRIDAYDDMGQLEISGSFYSGGGTGCRIEDGGKTFVFPTMTVGGLDVQPRLYADGKHPFGRQYFSIKNPGAAPLTRDIEMNGDLGSDSDTVVNRTSSGDATPDATDRWAVSCEDTKADGCAAVGGGQAVRDPELANNWEGPGAAESADVVVVAPGNGDYNVTFQGVTVPAGKTVAFMEVGTLATTIKRARHAANQADGDPAAYGVFRDLSKRERKRVRNW
jgi:hypothetical protein